MLGQTFAAQQLLRGIGIFLERHLSFDLCQQLEVDVEGFIDALEIFQQPQVARMETAFVKEMNCVIIIVSVAITMVKHNLFGGNLQDWITYISKKPYIYISNNREGLSRETLDQQGFPRHRSQLDQKVCDSASYDHGCCP